MKCKNVFCENYFVENVDHCGFWLGVEGEVSKARTCKHLKAYDEFEKALIRARPSQLKKLLKKVVAKTSLLGLPNLDEVELQGEDNYED